MNTLARVITVMGGAYALGLHGENASNAVTTDAMTDQSKKII
jgi:hypothetical protein